MQINLTIVIFDMNTKEIEQLGYNAFVAYLEKKFGTERFTIFDNRNKNERSDLGCDAIVVLDSKKLYIELKASKGKGLPTNIRFAHQTIATMFNAEILAQMIVVYVYNLSEGINAAKFKFFRFGDFKPEQVLVEPHFIIQPKQAIKYSEGMKIASPIKESLEEVLNTSDSNHDVGGIFETKVAKHMKLNNFSDHLIPKS